MFQRTTPNPDSILPGIAVKRTYKDLQLARRIDICPHLKVRPPEKTREAGAGKIRV